MEKSCSDSGTDYMAFYIEGDSEGDIMHYEGDEGDEVDDEEDEL